MFQFTVRAADHFDVNAICKITQKVFDPSIDEDELKRLCVGIIEDIEQIVMVAVNSNHVVGFIHARRVTDMIFGRYTEISEIAMLPYYQRRGGGSSLVFGVEQWSSQMLTNKIKCILKSQNEAVKALLLKCGYVENGLGAFEKTII